MHAVVRRALTGRSLAQQRSAARGAHVVTTLAEDAGPADAAAGADGAHAALVSCESRQEDCTPEPRAQASGAPHGPGH